MSANRHAGARLACALAAWLASAAAAAAVEDERPTTAAEEDGAPSGMEGAAPDAPAPAVPDAVATAGAAAPEVEAAGLAAPADAAAPERPASPVEPVPAPSRSEPATAAEAPAPPEAPLVRVVRRRGAGAKESALELEIHGRVAVGVGVDERDAWARDLDMRDARIGLEARLPGILTVVEADLSSRSVLRDAFVRLDGPGATRLQAGHFKAPFSARRLESSWRLPLVRRGLVDDYVIERNALGGRRFGAVGGVRPWGARLELAAGAFVGSSELASEEDDPRAEDLAALLAVRPWKGVELAATAYRAARDDGPSREAATAYLKLDVGPLETTIEGLAGHLRQGSFAAATALVAWTFRPGAGALRITPVASAEVLTLRAGAEGRGQAATLGAVLSWADGLKVKVEGERARRPGDDAPANAVAVQIATRF